ncbi:hypothetical protein C8J56DRAFT_1061800 [Mycena floridula]|nr:hypothetical protein C8J56DRAFT_473077 [Mycena floridula]KAJ7577098.1 hypothetical protein C8J56DRAFT_1061800 [Mycena floridula]
MTPFSDDIFEPRSASRASARSASYTFKRQIIHAWKVVTQSTRKQQRASFMPRDFILVTGRRRSMLRG